MKHKTIDQVLARAESAKTDSDFTYFFSLLLAAEALAKTIILGMVAGIAEDKDRNRYRLEHALVRADGIGEWGRVLEDALTGPASQYLMIEARPEQAQLTQLCKSEQWQHACVTSLKSALDHLSIESEPVPVKSDMKRWFRLFATLRNKTRAHGATQPAETTKAAEYLTYSIDLFYHNFGLFTKPWAYLHRNLSGKYRVSPITESSEPFEFLRSESTHSLPNGVYLAWSTPRRVPLIQSDPELQDFFFANGGLVGKTYELLSYLTGNKIAGDATDYITPPGNLPASETEGHGELLARGNCFSNTPDLIRDYVPRSKLEQELLQLLVDDKRPIVTLVGRGGIGKTVLALKVIQGLYDKQRYEAIIWLSARDVDLQLSGPKPVRPVVISPEDMGRLYASLVLSEAEMKIKGFNARQFLEKQLQNCAVGATLFVFDNFETTQNPVEMFNWVDSFLRLPNKALITTRLRDFKGDYPVEVTGMDELEARKLVHQTAAHFEISHLLTPDYIDELISQSEGHPYVIKILLGEVSKAGRAVNVPRLVAGSEDILTALFERTYSALTPCAQRAFLTLSAWNSAVPRLALEAVLLRSTEERNEVEKGVDSLLQFSIAELQIAAADNQEFISLPLVASVFGKKKLNISPFKAAVQADVEILRMLGPARFTDIHLSLAKRLESFIANISRRLEAGAAFESYSPILEMICRAYNPGWLLLARWHMEGRTTESYSKAKEELKRFLENDPSSDEAAEAWRMLAQACYRTGDTLGEIHAFIERAQITSVPFFDVSNTANRLNELLHTRQLDIDRDEKRALAERIVMALENRRSEAAAGDFSRMAWLAIHLGQEDKARAFAEAGLTLDPDHYHCGRIIEHLDRR